MSAFDMYFNPKESNEFQQLTVSVSKHYFVSAAGIYSYQKKELGATLKKPYLDRNRQPVVHFVLRDKQSAAFYAETWTADAQPPLVNFLHRAWSIKQDSLFCGIPQALSVPASLRTEEIANLLHSLDVEAVAPASGFDAGIAGVRLWESHLAEFYYRKCGFEFFQPQLSNYCGLINQSSYNQAGEVFNECWMRMLRTLRIPPPIDFFGSLTTFASRKDTTWFNEERQPAGENYQGERRFITVEHILTGEPTKEVLRNYPDGISFFDHYKKFSVLKEHTTKQD